MSARRILFLVRRIGPYHDARFEAAGRRTELTVVETRPASAEYPWTTAPVGSHYGRDVFPAAPSPEAALPEPGLAREVARVLAAHQPAVVACSGWADPEYHAVLRACHARGIPAIVMCDSTREDEPRHRWRELVKRSLVRNFGAAVVAGARSRDYLAGFGFPAPTLFAPLDVVDNDHFAAGAGLARVRAAAAPVPPRFLCVARFVPKKNLPRLLDAYAGYRAQVGAVAWGLVLSGSGELEPDLRRQVADLGLGAHVEFPGFCQYPDLPGLYARAGALVLPSLSDQWGLVVNEAMAAGLPVLVSRCCGCAPDLVREGGNGWIFDPEDPAALQELLHRVAALDGEQWRAMGQCSREIIAAYSPEAFALALEQAAGAAGAPASRRSSRLSRVVVGLMGWRHSLQP